MKRALLVGQVNLERLEERLGHRFRDRSLLIQALTHSSFTAEDPLRQPHNERLEFLGDAAIKLTTSDMLLSAFPQADEGLLSKARAYLVSDKHLGELAHTLGLKSLLRCGKSVESDRSRLAQTALLPNAMEAVIGAVFMDAGYQASDAVLRQLFAEPIRLLMLEDIAGVQLGPERAFRDYKSPLQELTVRLFKVLPTYVELGMEGPPHDRRFIMAVHVNDHELGRGEGQTKKEAGQVAAQIALEFLRAQEAAAMGGQPTQKLRTGANS